jgi:hypothetical protein
MKDKKSLEKLAMHIAQLEKTDLGKSVKFAQMENIILMCQLEAEDLFYIDGYIQEHNLI